MTAQKWNLDTVHSSVNFWVRHLLISKVHGSFSSFKGTFAFDESDPAASHVEVEIDAASVTTKEAQRDAHLRSPDFFDAEKFPKLTFKSTRFEKSGDEYKLTGDLTMHGVTKPVTLDVEFNGRTVHPQMGERIGFSARGSLQRKEWGVSFNQVLDNGGVALSEKVDLQLEIQGTKAA